MKPKTTFFIIGGVIVLVALISALSSGGVFSGSKGNLPAQVADTTPPVVTITSPIDGQIVSGNFNTCATATDNVGVTSIVLRTGGIPSGGTTSPLCIGWNTVNFANGFYTVYSTATDAAGNMGASPSIIAGVANNLTTPIVKATMPAPSATVSGQVTLGAKAYSPAGTNRVDFLIDGTSTVVATATTPSAPNTYTASWNSTTVANGSHNIIAKVYDINGLSMVSGVTFTVTNTGADVTPPTISSITSSAITSSGATISWTTNEVADTQVYYGTTSSYGLATTLNTTPTTTHSVTLSGLTGSTLYHFAVMSRDAAGNLATSSDQTFTTTAVVDTTPPAVSITSPVGGATVSGTVGVAATATDTVGVDHVDFYAGANFISADASLPYSINWDTATAANGSYALTARAYDAAGNNTTSNPVTVMVNNVVIPPPDTTPPTVSITAPTAGATVSGATVTVSMNAADNIGVTRVEVYRGGTTLITTDTTSPWAVTWNTTTVANGVYSLTAKAFDAAGNSTTSAAVSVTVSNPLPDTTLPTVAMTAPANGTSVSGSTVTLSATAADNVGVTRVEFYRGTTLISTDTTGSPGYSITWDTTTLQRGTYSLKAKAFDAAGNSKISTSVSVTVVDITPPVVAITNPTGSTIPSSGTVTVKTTATDISSIKYIKIYIDSVLKKQCNTTGTCNYNWSVTNVAVGDHTITVTAQDKAPVPNTTTVSKTVTK